MKPLSREQLEQVSEATAELMELHPELKLEDKRRALRKRIPEFADKEAEIRTMVVEVTPDEPEIRISRRVEELVALTEGRPAILIRNDDFDLEGHETLPDVLRALLRDNRESIKNAIRGVGRIEVSNHSRRSWLGTGFVIESEDGSAIVVTNRHVAVEMAFRRTDGAYQFVEGLVGGQNVTARLDLKEEVISVADDTSSAIPITEVLHIEEPSGPDLAFLRLGSLAGSRPVTRLSLRPNVAEKTPIAAIGYPAKDSTATDLDIVLGLLGDVYNKKRLAPGVLKSVSAQEVTHDCSTLGGNSGSPLVDLRTGAVVGLHAGGTYPNPRNFGVSAQLVAERLNDVSRPRRVRRLVERPDTPRVPVQVEAMKETVSARGQTVSFEMPLRITVELGTPHELHRVGVSSTAAPSVESAVAAAKASFGLLPGVVNVRPGLQLRHGEYSRNRVVVISMDYVAQASRASVAAIPESIQSVPIQVRAASAEDLLRARGAVALERVPTVNYQSPADLSLDAVDEEMFAVFHVSPDAGWPELQEFLSRTRQSLTIGLYNFATEHVEEELERAVAPDPRTLDLVLGDAAIDREETDAFEAAFVERFKDLMGDRFQYELADRHWELFSGHYHIKVAVRDGEAFWLSSGNWEPSNQPPVNPVASHETGWDLLRDRNREWHAVVLNSQLAQTFEQYIRYDLESYREIRTAVPEAPPRGQAEFFLVPRAGRVVEPQPGNATYFAPLFVRKRLHIQPLLTPDNFFDHVLPLVESAEESIDLQNQTLKWRHENVDERFEQLMNTLLEKHQAGVTVRIILRGDYSPEMKELLVEHGFDTTQIRLLSRCHTKGMIVDSRRTLLGSHNLSEYGAFSNRDASLIVTDEEVAGYYARIFQFDWDRAGGEVHETPPGISIYRPGDPVPAGYEVVSRHDLAL